jgi:hypothetical protein
MGLLVSPVCGWMARSRGASQSTHFGRPLTACAFRKRIFRVRPKTHVPLSPKLSRCSDLRRHAERRSIWRRLVYVIAQKFCDSSGCCSRFYGCDWDTSSAPPAPTTGREHASCKRLLVRSSAATSQLEPSYVPAYRRQSDDIIKNSKAAREHTPRWYEKHSLLVAYYRSYFAPNSEYLFSVYRDCRALQFADMPIEQLRQVETFLRTDAGRRFWSSLVDQDTYGCASDEISRILPRGQGEAYAVIGKKGPLPPA